MHCPIFILYLKKKITNEPDEQGFIPPVVQTPILPVYPATQRTENGGIDAFHKNATSIS